MPGGDHMNTDERRELDPGPERALDVYYNPYDYVSG
jgi:hypothetical protein